MAVLKQDIGWAVGEDFILGRNPIGRCLYECAGIQGGDDYETAA